MKLFILGLGAAAMMIVGTSSASAQYVAYPQPAPVYVPPPPVYVPPPPPVVAPGVSVGVALPGVSVGIGAPGVAVGVGVPFVGFRPYGYGYGRPFYGPYWHGYHR
jgi:hypothetical protein